MGEFVAQLYIGLAELFAGLLPRKFTESARTGPLWRCVIVAIFLGFASLAVGLVLGALALAVLFLVAGIVLGIARLF